jgi:hypothetical protein
LSVSTLLDGATPQKQSFALITTELTVSRASLEKQERNCCLSLEKELTFKYEHNKFNLKLCDQRNDLVYGAGRGPDSVYARAGV